MSQGSNQLTSYAASYGYWEESKTSNGVSESHSQAVKIISPGEVAKHSTAKDIWVVVNGDVYDVTGYDHPGGFGSLLGAASKSDKNDVTASFKKQGHSPGALDKMRSRKVGELATKKRK